MIVRNISGLPLKVQNQVINTLISSVSTFISKHTIIVPKSLKTETIPLETDAFGFIKDNELLKSALIGTSFDYLTRIIVCKDINAFDFLLPWYEQDHPHDLNGLKKLKYLNEKVKIKYKYIDIDQLNIDELRLIVEISSFEQYLRSEKKERKEPNLDLVDGLTLQHIKIMLYRSRNFFNRFGKSKLINFDCLIGDDDIATDPMRLFNEDVNYLNAVINGDGDYLLDDAIVDFKVYRKNGTRADWKKQLLLYYFGLINYELKDKGIDKNKIHYLINYNPRYDKAYKYSLDTLSIQDKKIFMNTIMLGLEHNTNEARKVVYKYYEDMQERGMVTEDTAKNYRNPFLKYSNGIHQILRDDYIKFYRSKRFFEMKCRWLGQYYLVKRNNYYMFFLKRNKSLYFLDGGHILVANHDLTYYYDNLVTYAQRVKQGFSSYGATLLRISEEVKLFGGTGKIHGTIVDIDYKNHIYLKPKTGEIKPYFAENTLSRIHYSSVRALLSDNKTNETTEYFQNIYQKKLDHKKMLRLYNKHTSELTYLNNNHEISYNLPQKYESYLTNQDNEFEDYYDKDMYYRSRLLNKVQYLYEINTIRFWRDKVVQFQEPIKLIPVEKNRKKLFQNNSLDLSFKKTKELQNLHAQITRPQRFNISKGFRISAKKYKSKKVINSSLLQQSFVLNDSDLFTMIYSAVGYLIPQLPPSSSWRSFLSNYKFDHEHLAIADKDIGDKLITQVVLNEFNKLLKAIFSLTNTYGKPISVRKIINNKAFIDVEFDKIYIDLDLLKSPRILKTMDKNLRSIKNDIHGKKLGILNLVTGMLYVMK